MALEPRSSRKLLYAASASNVLRSCKASKPGRKRWNWDSSMNSEHFRLLLPSLPHICAKMRKQKNAKPSSLYGLSLSFMTTRFAGVASACRNWLNCRSTRSEATMRSRYFLSSRMKEGTTCGRHSRICANAMSCMWASSFGPGTSSSRNSLILPRAWMAMKTSVASTASAVESFTVCSIHSWIQAQDCLESWQSCFCSLMKASYCLEMSQYTESMAPKVWSRFSR
mmetsp:Transcript_27282/g.75050  ORF Transcript_27282/g.75050 Transcript_27282/m.75050 type:complete len:225 (+) Transcript_27282:1102-1776(+)